MKLLRPLWLALAMTAIMATGAVAQTFKVLHNFGGPGDGWSPFAGLVASADGQLYGVTIYGAVGSPCPLSECGTVFKLSPNRDGSWTETLLYQFTGGLDQSQPVFPVAFDSRGNLYGTTQGNIGEYGTVWELTPNGDGTWSQKTLYTFTGGTDGGQPFGIAVAGIGRLYGSTYRYNGNYTGAVFSLAQPSVRNWVENVVHLYGNGSDGGGPVGKVIFDAAGNMYGTTYEGGLSGNGTVYKLSANADGSGWNETILYSFAGSPDGAHPYAGLLWDSAGNLYGTTEQGGTHAAGTVFMLAPNPDGRWIESVLYTFTGQNDGANPDAGLAFDSSGNLYGTTTGGGAGSRGTVFKLSRSVGGQWTETVLHSFDLQDGSDPSNLGSLVVDAAGNLYGTTIDGGQYGLGVVFEVSP
jgi:uncharacterized repeat protein (TIGR03803 family)